MSLHVYDWVDEQENLIPMKVIEENDNFFDIHTIIPDTDTARFFLEYIDKAKYCDEEFFIDRNGAKLSKDCLSSGCKTALNIISNPGYCFSTVECGHNATYAVLKAGIGNVYWWESFFDIPDDSCDIIYKGKHFTKITKFVKYLEEVA